MAQCKRSVQTARLDVHNISQYEHDLEKGRALLRKQCRAKHDGKLVGEIVRFPVADGYAQYMVEKEKPLRLIHLADGDAWHADSVLIRGLRLVDVQQRVSASRRMASLFARKSA